LRVKKRLKRLTASILACRSSFPRATPLYICYSQLLHCSCQVNVAPYAETALRAWRSLCESQRERRPSRTPAIRGPTGRSAPEPELRSALQKLNGSTGSQVVQRQARHRDPSSRELRAMSRLQCSLVIVYCVTRSYECCVYGAIMSRGWMARVAVPRLGSTEERIPLAC
jgi:hypothetical protein